jgi:K(+)-stimulated pyrophosphate-energized sodium pump
MEAATTWLPLLIGAIGVGVAFAVYRVVVAYPAGDAKVTDIAEQIYIGAMAFMRREFQLLAIVGVILIVLLWIGLGWQAAVAFAVGAGASALAGFFGMVSATKANVRTTTAAHTKGAAASADGVVLRRLRDGPPGRLPRPPRARLRVLAVRR